MMGGGIVVIAIANCGGGCFVSIPFSFVVFWTWSNISQTMKSKIDTQMVEWCMVYVICLSNIVLNPSTFHVISHKLIFL